MFDKIKQTPAAVKKFVVEHKTAVTVAITTTVCLALNRAALNSHNEFLKEHELYDTYYQSEEE